uniref:Uncharacterized protein n=1 Tax=Paramoeba aestuarina TaxID=180227 RepID=A0A7S4KHR7_9EUKA|mmetsp:Transcript_19477/g.30522  ORF Transcript_19477/g.30522 Transcript_19477/m.30522 type:complete len:175 (+) Transcript_19477:49-573(+)
MYCNLKANGVRVKLVTFKDLVYNRTNTMKELGQFLNVAKPWEGKTAMHHKPITDRIENLNEVSKYFNENAPEDLCMLYENCKYPPIDCEKEATQELRLSDQAVRDRESEREKLREREKERERLREIERQKARESEKERENQLQRERQIRREAERIHTQQHQHKEKKHRQHKKPI